MGRNLKGKASKAGAARSKRKKSGLGAGGSSPALSATSSSGGPMRQQILLEGVAKAWPVGKKSVASTGCQICDFVAFRRSQRPCVDCTRTGVKATTPTKEETKGEENEKRRGLALRQLPTAFSTTGKDPEDAKAVLVDNDEVLYNALITEVDTSGERIKIHFTRWSKSFDDWYAMDDEHINESSPAIAANQWKDSTYVCPRCIDDARAFHNGNRSVLKAKAAYISTSNAIAKASKKVTSPKESETASVAVAKTKKANMEEEKNGKEAKEEAEEDVRIAKVPHKRKRKLSEAADSSVMPLANESANEQASAGAAHASSMPAKDSADSTSPSRASSATSEVKCRPNVKESNAEGKANASKTPAVDANAAVVAIEAHSSPSKAATAKIGASNKSAVGEAKLDKQEKKQTLKTESAADHSSRQSSSNTVMSLLNSPPTNEASAKGFKPTVTSLPMLNPAGNRKTQPPPNFQVYVKMEQKNGRFPLYPRPMPNVKAALAVRKDVSAPPTKAKAPVVRKTKQTQAGGRGLSAFDILREVASQEIDESAVPVKPKREKRPAAVVGAMPVPTNEQGWMHRPPDTNQSPQTRERIQMNSFVDLHFSIRKEMYLRFSVPYPPTVAKPIATTVPHAPPAAIRSPMGGKGLAGLPMSMGMFSAGLNRNTSPAGTSRIGMLPPPPDLNLRDQMNPHDLRLEALVYHNLSLSLPEQVPVLSPRLSPREAT
ncbi:hypothetical protein GQ600_25593 [Phytophthora cactorum]|nr:hypothetical protein GQ600_25593 [Phytophthora cactorum]